MSHEGHSNQATHPRQTPALAPHWLCSRASSWFHNQSEWRKMQPPGYKHGSKECRRQPSAQREEFGNIILPW